MYAHYHNACSLGIYSSPHPRPFEQGSILFQNISGGRVGIHSYHAMQSVENIETKCASCEIKCWMNFLYKGLPSSVSSRSFIIIFVTNLSPCVYCFVFGYFEISIYMITLVSCSHLQGEIMSLYVWWGHSMQHQFLDSASRHILEIQGQFCGTRFRFHRSAVFL